MSVTEAGAEITRLPDRTAQAWATQDADAFASVFAEDGSMIFPGGVYRRGREEIREYMAAGYAGPYRGLRAADRVLDVRFVAADTAIMITEGGLMAPGETEVPAERLVRATWTVVRQGDDWLVAAYHNCPAA